MEIFFAANAAEIQIFNIIQIFIGFPLCAGYSSKC